MSQGKKSLDGQVGWVHAIDNSCVQFICAIKNNL